MRFRIRSSVYRPAYLGTRVLPLAMLFAASLAALPQSASNPQSSTAREPVLVELFTSEGCSSCPPADKLLMDLDRKQPIPGVRVIVLSEHVDYWNSLGWRDPFSSHQWSERQDEYGRQFGLDSVYTPQMVIDGSHQVVGSDDSALRSAVEAAARGRHVQIGIANLTRTGNTIKVDYTTGPASGTILYAAVADDSDRSSVARGENSGRTLEHVAVARSLTRVAELNGSPLTQNTEIAIPPEASGRRLRLILFAREIKTGHIVGVDERGL